MALMMTMTAMMMMMVLCAMQSHTICATSHLKYSQKCRFFPLIHAVAPTFIHDNFRLIASLEKKSMLHKCRPRHRAYYRTCRNNRIIPDCQCHRCQQHISSSTHSPFMSNKMNPSNEFLFYRICI